MNGPASLADHLVIRGGDVLSRWREAIERAGGDSSRTRPADPIRELLARLGERLRGRGESPEVIGRLHGLIRRQQGFDLAEVVSELGHLRTALRRSCFEAARCGDLDIEGLETALDALHALLDEAIAEAARVYGSTAPPTAAQLLSEHERLRLLSEVYPGVIYEHDLASGRTVHSDGLRELVGYAPDEIDSTGDWWHGLIEPEDLVRVQARYQAILEAGGSKLDREYRVRHRDGRRIWVWDQARIVRDADGRPTRLVGLTLDITDRKRAESETLAIEHRHRATFEIAAIGIGHLDLMGRWREVNPALCRMLGYSAAELQERDLASVTHPDDRAAALEQFGHLEKPEAAPIQLEQRWLRKDGSHLLVRLIGSMAFDDRGRPDHVVACIEDITTGRLAASAQARYTALLEESRDPILFVRPADGRIVDANPAALITYGYSRETLLGLSIVDLRAPETRARVAEQLAQADAGGAVFETIHQRRDGTRFPVEISARGVEVGGERLIVSLVRDLTERHRSEQALRDSEERLRLAVEVTGLGTWDLNLCTGALSWSDSCRAIFGLQPGEEVDLERFYRHVHPDDRERIGNAMARAIDPNHRTEFEIDYRILRPDGTIRWLSALGRAIFEGEGAESHALRFLGTVLDVTGRKALEADLARQREAAEAASLHKTRLLAAISHDARTPLNAVVLAAELLEPHADEPRSPEVVESLRTIRHSVRNVLDLLNDLLDLTRIDAGALPAEMERFELGPALEECVASIEAQARRKGLVCCLEVEGLVGLVIDTDRAKLKQILGNFLSNALRYTEHGQIRLFGGLQRGRLRISVADTGVGIAEADQSRIFDEFARLEGARTTVAAGQDTGLGLGLAICRRLAGLLRGEILVRSEPGSGSTFTLELPAEIVGTARPESPRRAEPAAPTSSSTAPQVPPQGRAILVAEDHEDSRRVLARVLVRLGYRVLAAENGREAVALARAERPMAALLDVVMPVMDGIEAARELRADPDLADLPLFALTGNLAPETRRALIAVGFRGLLDKPVSLAALRQTLDGIAADDAAPR